MSLVLIKYTHDIIHICMYTVIVVKNPINVFFSVEFSLQNV